MFRNIILALSALFAVPAMAATEDNTVVLSDDNTAVLNWVVTDQSVANVLTRINEISHNLSKSKPIYLVLDTPGGSVEAGNNLIDALRGIPQEVKTISLFSASMGFQIAQNLGERLVTPNSVMMSHQAYGGEEGTIPGSLNVRLGMWMGILDNLDTIAAKRLKLSKSEYRQKIQNEYWVYGENNLKEHTADRSVTVTCDESLKGTSYQTVYTFFGPVGLERANCPMVRGIISVNFAEDESTRMRAFDFEQFKQAVFTLNNNKLEFLRDFITTGKFISVGF